MADPGVHCVCVCAREGHPALPHHAHQEVSKLVVSPSIHSLTLTLTAPPPPIRVLDQFPGTEMAKFAGYCQQNMRRTKHREHPPSRNEIIACLVSVGTCPRCSELLS